jgi:hypothetical protein
MDNAVKQGHAQQGTARTNDGLTCVAVARPYDGIAP